MALDLITETGTGQNPIGKKSVLLNFNRHWGYVAGVDIGNFKIRIGLFDMLGEKLGYREIRLEDITRGPEIFSLIEHSLVNLMAESNLPLKRMAAITLGIPGVRDYGCGLNRLAPFMTEWEDQDLTRELAYRVCERIYIQNNVNLGMLGEQWKGNANEVQNAIYFEFGIGVGAGILVNNSILLGSRGTAGEIAFARFDAEPSQEFYKDMGVFEQIVSTRAILSDYAKLSGDLIPEEPIEALTFIFDRYDSGELAAKTIIGKVLDIISRAFISLSATLNPDVLIIGGGMGECLMRHKNFFNEELARYVPYPPVIKPAGCNSAVVWGAVRYALDKLGPAGIIDLAKQRR